MNSTDVVRQMIERAFNTGDLGAVDELLAPGAVDHQETPDTNFRVHLKQVISMLRTAFPDLHFEIQHLLSDGDIVAMNSVMTGTHSGPFRGLPATGRSVRVRHMHFVHVVGGQGHDLWHLWDMPELMKQLTPEPSHAAPVP
ncbi:ester cyclase (plasmid) [Deinococcus taeanensis]|uniref:ester cyclase n=1 Tax=Deinococcus taeanensis TaxID=2737050 RepID=UPI001CDC1226|nr:ester cyclase [Deinococcus taeanensis]UBV45259.1 ester cyclase [Deinococcus taeanensis]